MEVLSTVEAWRELAQISDANDRESAWVGSYEARYPSLFEVYYSAWGERSGRGDAALRAPGLQEQVLAAEDRARRLLAQAENDFRNRGLLDDELHAVLLVGSQTSNGWVAEHDGRRWLFLALECLGEPPYDDLLVVHELTHVVQAQLSPATGDRTYAASLLALVEGAATATSRLLRPGHSDSAYLWMDEDHREWLDRCTASAPTIATLLLRHADTPDDDQTVAALFRNRASGDVPARSGYWAGELIARKMLHDGYDLHALLSVGLAEARARVLDWATTTNR